MGLSVTTIEADVSAVVSDEGQITERFSEVNGAIFTVAVVEGVGSRDDTVEEGVDWLVEGPGAADSVVSTEGVGGSSSDGGDQQTRISNGRGDGSSETSWDRNNNNGS